MRERGLGWGQPDLVSPPGSVITRSGEGAQSNGHEQALVCLSNREIVDASRGCTFHCKLANNRFFL